MKKRSGVTMIELAIVIIIILMIISFSFISGMKTTNDAKITELFAEIKSVKESVIAIQFDMGYQENFELIQGIHYDREATTEEKEGLSNTEDFYVIYGFFESEDSIVRSNIGLKDLKRTYLVNFKTGEVALKTPVEISGVTVRTYEEIKNLAK